MIHDFRSALSDSLPRLLPRPHRGLANVRASGDLNSYFPLQCSLPERSTNPPAFSPSSGPSAGGSVSWESREAIQVPYRTEATRTMLPYFAVLLPAFAVAFSVAFPPTRMPCVSNDATDTRL